MELNQEIRKRAIEHGMNPDDVFTFLLSLHFRLSPKNYLEDKQFIVCIQLIGVIKVNPKVGFEWVIPLFVDEKGKEVKQKEDDFSWVVTEYCKLFGAVGKDKYHRESVLRLKKLFSISPSIRKDDVIGATEMYLDQVDHRYVRNPHYFIYKGIGASMESDLMTWIVEYKKSTEANLENNRDKYNSLQ